jgi:hypothetical protein
VVQTTQGTGTLTCTNPPDYGSAGTSKNFDISTGADINILYNPSVGASGC